MGCTEEAERVAVADRIKVSVEEEIADVLRARRRVVSPRARMDLSLRGLRPQRDRSSLPK